MAKEERHKGAIKQIKEFDHSKAEPLTEKKIIDAVEKALLDTKDKGNIVFMRYCINQGWITESNTNFPSFCGDPECASCTEMWKALDEGLKNLFKDKPKP